MRPGRAPRACVTMSGGGSGGDGGGSRSYAATAAAREALRQAVRDRDLLRLEDALAAARGHVEPAEVADAEDTLRGWLRACGGLRDELAAAMQRREDLPQMVEKIAAAEASASRALLRGYVRRAKNLVVATERAMKAIKPALDSGSAVVVDSFLSLHGGVLPDDVYKEVAALRETYLRTPNPATPPTTTHGSMRGPVSTPPSPSPAAAAATSAQRRVPLSAGAVVAATSAPPATPLPPTATTSTHYVTASISGRFEGYVERSLSPGQPDVVHAAQGVIDGALSDVVECGGGGAAAATTSPPPSRPPRASHSCASPPPAVQLRLHAGGGGAAGHRTPRPPQTPAAMASAAAAAAAASSARRSQTSVVSPPHSAHRYHTPRTSSPHYRHPADFADHPAAASAAAAAAGGGGGLPALPHHPHAPAQTATHQSVRQTSYPQSSRGFHSAVRSTPGRPHSAAPSPPRWASPPPQAAVVRATSQSVEDSHHTERLRLYLAEISRREALHREERRACQQILKEMVGDLSTSKTLRISAWGGTTHSSPPPPPPPALPLSPPSPPPPLATSSAAARDEYAEAVLHGITQPKLFPDEEEAILREQQRAIDERRRAHQLRLRRLVAQVEAEQAVEAEILAKHEEAAFGQLARRAAVSGEQVALLLHARAEFAALEARFRAEASGEEAEARAALEELIAFEAARLAETHDRLAKLEREECRIRTMEAKLAALQTQTPQAVSPQRDDDVAAARPPSPPSPQQAEGGGEEARRLLVALATAEQRAERAEANLAALRVDLEAAGRSRAAAAAASEAAAAALTDAVARAEAAAHEEAGVLRAAAEQAEAARAAMVARAEAAGEEEAAAKRALEEATAKLARVEAAAVAEAAAAAAAVAAAEAEVAAVQERSAASVDGFVRGAVEMIHDEQRGRYSMWEHEVRMRTVEEDDRHQQLRNLHAAAHLASAEEPLARAVWEEKEQAGRAALEQSPELMQLFSMLEDDVATEESSSDADE